ncbi:MAG: hypothetical protein KTR24_11465 [Saprospiraceae bacterium]|nr:hypothetical protein [Saprospiraceae bacterium]
MMKSRCFEKVYVALLGVLIASCDFGGPYDEALTPAESMATFDLIEGFELDAYAVEPHVMDPVELKFDAAGKAFVVEMPDYPFKPDPGKGRGKIKQLHDDDGDGVIDRSTVFAQGISEATSILPWKEGLIVTAAPNILFLQDLDQDGTCDSTEILFTGFFENNSEAQITNLTYGLDNWIYASNHGQSGTVTYQRDTSQPALQMQGGDFRFRLDRNKFELEAGPAQFGQTFNDRCHRFITQNSLHIRHAVIPWRYTHRHPYLFSTQVAHNISDHEAEMFQETPAPHWRAERTARRQVKYEEQGLDRREYAEDYFTGCSGGTFYGGHAFPPEFYGNVFTGDVAGNLIHRDLLVAEGQSPTYVASRAPSERHREFLFAKDSWFRPAHFTVGPDGFLYVVDYYRQHIETPLSIPADLKEQMDFLNGHDMGRLYRIRPTGSGSEADRSILVDASTLDLVATLKHPNRWQRLTAQRLLLERQDTSCIPALLTLFANDDLRLPRLHALYALEGMNALSEEIIRGALNASYAPLREHGLMLAERLPNGHRLMVPFLTDPDARVALQAVLSLGEFDQEPVAQQLSECWSRFHQDKWFRMAVLSSRAALKESFIRSVWASKKRTDHGAKELAYVTLLASSKHQTPALGDELVTMIVYALSNDEREKRLSDVRKVLTLDDNKELRKYLNEWLDAGAL